MPEPPTEARKMLPLGTKPSYYIVLRRFPIIAGLMQVEIMAIISPAEVGGASFSMSKSLCVEVDGRRLINSKKKKRIKKKKLRAGYYALPSSISHLNPSSPPFTLHAALLLPFSPSLPVSLHKLISPSLPLSALSLSLL